MPDAMTESKKPSLTAAEILAWLKANPNFLNSHPEALDLLAPPKAVAGKGVADFQTYMVKRLKADRDEVLESAREMVATSRANMNNQTRVHKAVLLLMEARSFADFIRTITLDMTSLLDVDIISIVVEASGKVIPQIAMAGVRAVGPGSIDVVMKDKKILLQADIAGLEEIYGGGAGLVKSQALLRMEVAANAPATMLAFGSRDKDLFQSGQGTELIAFLGGVIGRLMRIWLDVEG
jgi:uncharacterized protein YigA (DUF484 family)